MKKQLECLQEEQTFNDLQEPWLEYEGGSRDRNLTKSTKEAGVKIKKLFNREDPLGTTHLKDMNQQLQQHGSEEKTGFMEKEADFVKNLKNV